MKSYSDKRCCGYYELLAVVLCLPIFYFSILWISTGLMPFKWDGGWYRGIAELGYQFDGNIDKQSNVAFLPGYPIFIALLKKAFGLNYVASQFLASALAFSVGGVFLFKYLLERIGLWCSLMAILLLGFNPYAIYYFNGYSEALFLPILAGFIYFIGKEKFLIASAILSLGLITRPHAILLMPLLCAAIYMSERVNDPKKVEGSTALRAVVRLINLLPVVLTAPMLLTLFYYIKFGDSLVYVNAISAWSIHNNNLSGLQFLSHIFSSVSHLISTPESILGIKFWIDPIRLGPLVFLLNVIVLFLSFHIFLKKGMWQIFCFYLLMTVFALITGSVFNFGRHTVFLNTYIIVFPIILEGIVNWVLEGKENSESVYRRLLAMLSLFLMIMTFFAGLYLFTIYGIAQLNGVWIS